MLKIKNIFQISKSCPFSTTTSTKYKHNGRVAVLTASTSGIALEAARRLGKEGAKIVLSSRKQENVEQAVNELRSEGIDVFGKVCHVSKKEDRQALMKAAADKYGGIDYLFSNAAANPKVTSFLETEEQVFDKVMDVNVKGMFLCVQDAVPYMRNRDNASIILHSSAIAYTNHHYPGVYATSKTALLGLSIGLMEVLGPEQIRCNVLAPTSTETKFGSAITKNPKFWSRVEDVTPYRRTPTLAEITGSISFLFSDQAKYVTGETITLAGAAWIRL